MNRQKSKRRQFFANKMHRELFLLVFFALLIPTIITATFVFYLIFYITAEQIGIPEAVAYNIFPAAKRVAIILSIALPLIIVPMLIFAHKLTHKMVGPFDRIIRELDECIKGTKKGYIVVRKDDQFLPLVARINALLGKLYHG